jgi:hypothetical protein
VEADAGEHKEEKKYLYYRDSSSILSTVQVIFSRYNNCAILAPKMLLSQLLKLKKLKTPWHETASELYRPNVGRLSAKLVSTFADTWCYVGSMTDPYGRILGFLDRSRYFFFQAAP